jgi:hypothetical protein
VALSHKIPSLAVYILDTGLDTNHIEFSAASAGNHQREVKNIFNAFAKNPLVPGTATDGHGHGRLSSLPISSDLFF